MVTYVHVIGDIVVNMRDVLAQLGGYFRTCEQLGGHSLTKSAFNTGRRPAVLVHVLLNKINGLERLILMQFSLTRIGIHLCLFDVLVYKTKMVRVR